MAMKTKSNNEAVPPPEPAHFVPLGVIRAEYQGKLARYMARHNTADVVVTMPLEIDVAGAGKQKFFVAVAVTTHFDEAESLADEVARMAPKKHKPLFAWVPAHLYGSDEFGIFIDAAPIGENLKNGMIAEVIDAAAIEEAVATRGKATA
ncbi:MAG: hypothetical protein VW472_05360 [Candidatus Puniceispirillum sp.]